MGRGPDARFFEPSPALTVGELAERIGGALARGGDRTVSAVAPLAVAGPGEVAFLGDRRYLPALSASAAACVIVPATAVEAAPPGAAVIVSAEAQAAWARASLLFHRPLALTRAAAPEAVAEDDTVVFEPGVVLGPGARVGRGSRIGAHTVIGPGVQIGRDCVVGSNVTVGFALIGDRVRILSGARIGEPGFGAAGSHAGPVDVPQLGRVILQDGVSVGANTCIDRGAYDDTVIGENTKIDNLCMIAHNCVVGRNCLMAAHTGLSGSVTVGDGVMFGGQAGVGDHLSIGEGARVAAGAGVLQDIPAGETWSGYPAKPLRQSLREAVWLAKQASGKAGARKGRDD
ncbi:UDP-3-O-(3-hydroxymyristoyl)glucosamine N-acyltransferase [uncultured Brevundimonas sp.]|uniref:UDP-3-O-(3-hydroxymyristoyl)glucosamine N-acyltransferase n=1 Tax=uncultured Brevundimonas sp. TaxID=213418 RepID=UPI002624D0A3|nr:UDP-3-O-(3-hydroxymyristoyl)glucosamine N-acyltransferase [uncultured Brevundimonas sp.]